MIQAVYTVPYTLKVIAASKVYTPSLSDEPIEYINCNGEPKTLVVGY